MPLSGGGCSLVFGTGAARLNWSEDESTHFHHLFTMGPMKFDDLEKTAKLGRFASFLGDVRRAEPGCPESTIH